MSEKVRKERKTHEKSAMYPAISISGCLEFVRKIDSLGGKSVSYSSVLDLMGLSSPTTKSFMYRISACKQFGFLTTGGSAVQLTDLTKRILYPVNGEDEVKQLLLVAFRNAPLYEKIIDRFKDKELPGKIQLGNVLMNEYRILKPVKDIAAECFIESALYLGILKNGVLCLEDEEIKQDITERKEAKESEKNEKGEAIDSNANIFSIVDKNKNIEIVEKNEDRNGGYSFEIPTLQQETAKFYIPAGVTSKDLDYIKLYVENMLPVFLDNLKFEIETK